MYLLVLCTLLAALLRVIGLNSQLWCDEIVTLVNSIRVPTWTLLTSYFYDNQHTFYALLAQASVAVFGEHPWTVRLPAMILGTASIPALYFLGRELTDRFEALAAAGLLAVSYHHIWFSQNARGYTALMLATLLATLCLVRGLKQPGWRPWLLYAVIVALGMYTHLTMIFVAFSHALVCGWVVLRPGQAGGWQTSWQRPLAAFVLAGSLTLLLYAPMLGSVVDFFLHKPTGMKAVSTPGWAFFETWTVLQKGLGGLRLVAVPALLVVAVVMGCGMVSYLRQNGGGALLLLVLPALVTFGGALAGRGTMYPRFFFYLLGFALLLVVRGIAVLSPGLTALLVPGASPRLPELAPASLVLLLMACSAASLGNNYLYPKQDFKGAMAYVEMHQTDGEPVVTAGVPATFCYQQYYDRPWEELTEVRQLDSLRAAGRPVWLVVTMPQYLTPANAALAAAIHQQFEVVQEFKGTLNGGSVFVCRAEPPSREKQKP